MSTDDYLAMVTIRPFDLEEENVMLIKPT